MIMVVVMVVIMIVVRGHAILRRGRRIWPEIISEESGPLWRASYFVAPLAGALVKTRN
jgi:hypothetical protein